MKKIILLGTLLMVVFAAAVGNAAVRDPKRLEDTATPEADVAPHGHKSLLDMFHNPWPGVTMGADMRLRWISAKNITTLDDDPMTGSNKWQFNRYRFRWGNHSLCNGMLREGHINKRGYRWYCANLGERRWNYSSYE